MTVDKNIGASKNVINVQIWGSLYILNPFSIFIQAFNAI